MYQNSNNNEVIYERNEFDMDFDLDQVVEMVGGDGQEREIELSCKLVELILIIVMMLWWVGLEDLVILFGLKML